MMMPLLERRAYAKILTNRGFFSPERTVDYQITNWKSGAQAQNLKHTEVGHYNNRMDLDYGAIMSNGISVLWMLRRARVYGSKPPVMDFWTRWDKSRDLKRKRRKRTQRS